MKIHVFQHIPFEHEAHIGRWAADRGHRVTRTRFYADDPIPATGEIDLLVITGGFMNVYEYEKYPWLYREKTHILDAIRSGIPVVGLCLGAQLIADVLGGRVCRNREPEIGWFPVTLTPEGREHAICAGLPDSPMAFHWHGDTFGLPDGAVHLAESQACVNQAFLYDRRVLGLQFHLEYSREDLEAMLTHCGDELVEAPYVQSPDEIRADAGRMDACHSHLCRLLDNLAALARRA